MKPGIINLLKRLPELNLNHISVCFTLRERGDRAKRLWTKRGMPISMAASFSEYWKRRAVQDPALALRIVSTYLEHYSKSGDPSQSMDCSKHPEKIDVDTLLESPGPYVEKTIMTTISEAIGEPKPHHRVAPPPLADQITSFSKSVSRWAASGLKSVTDEVFNERKSICAGCEFWDSKALSGTGRCRICGCSTWAKLRMSTESCPLNKWSKISA